MARAQKLHIGQELTEFPGGSINECIARIPVVDRLAGARPNPAGVVPEARSPFLVRIKWTGESTLPIGNVVKLGDVLIEPKEEDASPVFQGLQFEASEPGEDDAAANVAITLGPIRPVDDNGRGGIGYAHLAGAVWAKVDVDDEEHDAADVAATTVLESAEGGRFPILWKQAGTGEKWAVVLLSGAGATGPEETLWALDPAGGHTIATSGTTLTLTLKTIKHTFSLVNFVDSVPEDVEIVYTGGDCT